VHLKKVNIIFIQTRSSAIAKTAGVTMKLVIAVDWLTLTVTLKVSYVNFISLIKFSVR